MRAQQQQQQQKKSVAGALTLEVPPPSRAVMEAGRKVEAGKLHGTGHIQPQCCPSAARDSPLHAEDTVPSAMGCDAMRLDARAGVRLPKMLCVRCRSVGVGGGGATGFWDDVVSAAAATTTTTTTTTERTVGAPVELPPLPPPKAGAGAGAGASAQTTTRSRLAL